MINPYIATKPNELDAKKRHPKPEIGPQSHWRWFAIAGALGPAVAWVICVGFLNYAPSLGVNETMYNLILGIPSVLIAITLGIIALNFGHTRIAIVSVIFWLAIELLQVWLTLAFING